MIRTCADDVPTFINHNVPLPRCCPVSGNPAPGSMLRVSYYPAGVVIPVEDLAAWVSEYIDGHFLRDIRNMEEMIQDIAKRCSETVHVRVRVVADLLIDPPGGGEQQEMRVAVTL